MEERNQIVGVQYLRGIAAIGVVLCHYTAFSLGMLGVPVFFLISGFINVYVLTVANYVPNRILQFLLKRLIKVEPCYIAVIFMTLGLFKFLSFIPDFHGQVIQFLPGQFLAHIFFLVPFTHYSLYSSVFWTLCVEFQLYLIIGALYFLSNRLIYKTIFLISFSLTCFIPIPNAYFMVFTYAPIFAIGMALVIFYRTRRISYLLLIIGMLLIVGYKFGSVTSFILAISCLAIIYIKVIITPLSFLGNVSYSLYLTHPIVLIVISGLIKRIDINLDQHTPIVIVVKLLCAIMTAYIFYFIFEKPFKKYSSLVKLRVS